MIPIERIRKYIVEELLDQQQPVNDDDDLLIGGLLDSMAITQLVVFIEGEFSIHVPAEDLRIENFQTVNKIMEYLGSVQSS